VEAHLPQDLRVVDVTAVFDGRNIYNPQVLREMGFHYEGIGRR